MFNWDIIWCIILVTTIAAYPTNRVAPVVPSFYSTPKKPNQVGFVSRPSYRQQQHLNGCNSRTSWSTLENASHGNRKKRRILSLLSSSSDIVDNGRINSRSPTNSSKQNDTTKLSLIRTWLKRFALAYLIFTIGYQLGGHNSARKIIQNIIALDIHTNWNHHHNNNHESLFQILVQNQKNNPIKQMVRRFPFLSLITSAWIVRELWALVPLWIKQSHFVRRPGRLTGHEQFERDLITRQSVVDPDDIANLGNLGMKLQGLLQVAKTKLQLATNANDSSTATTPPQDLEVLAPSLILIQLLKQYKARKMKDRTQFYDESGSTCVTTDDMDELSVSHLPISSFWTPPPLRKEQQQQQQHNPATNPKHLLHGLDETFEWADWAYDESKLGTLKENLERNGFSLLRHDKTQKPGYVGHYVALSKERNLVVIGVKGTSTLEDLLTDCCGSAVTHTLDAPFTTTILDKENDKAHNIDSSNKKETSRRSNQIRCHEGVLISSKRLAQDLQPFMEELILPTSYNILIVGHSLGAAAASLLGVLLKSRNPSLATDIDGKRLKVVAFACPPILDYQNARTCSSFITTIVNNSDVITRSSLANLSISLELLKETNKKLQEEGLLSSSGAMINRKSTTALLRKLAEGTKGKLIFQPHELKDMADRAYEKVDIADPDHLYVPGQVIIMYKRWENSKEDEKEVRKAEGDIVGSLSTLTTKLKVKQRPRDTSTYYGADDFVISKDGTAKVLRSIEMNEKMLSDHMPPAYRASIRSLLEK